MWFKSSKLDQILKMKNESEKKYTLLYIYTYLKVCFLIKKWNKVKSDPGGTEIMTQTQHTAGGQTGLSVAWQPGEIWGQMSMSTVSSRMHLVATEIKTSPLTCALEILTV